ncbi:hypothetical protein BCL76_105243 [Streptomyces sp. CG 926]|uniref:hypothetical protein n=1 Tax=Streptomyces sp. CG 926 TaxID=1882405 RepID=UPI000D7AAC3F|nr:hypothetical protein [Streptomyces sp. CG 926]PWK70290.1 hypothetical protein BCL76_105243 [Streptomyces sp. CG 926]
MRQHLECLSVDTVETATAIATVPGQPSADLLDRALVGWERFLGTLEGTTDE